MRFFTSVHLLLLAYIIAAIIFWERSLQKLNGQIYAQQVLTLRSQVDSARAPTVYNEQMALLQNKLKMRTTQYVAEGTTFLVVILIGAAVVYRSLQRRIMLSRQQNNFMLSVTHELKSPIAGIKLNLQTLERRQLDDEKKELLINRSIKEADRLNDLCNNMLLTSRIEGRQYKPSIEIFDLSGLVEETVDEFAGRYSRMIQEDIMPGCRIKGDKTTLEMAVNNLIENAIKYSPEEKPITVRLDKKKDCVVLQIIDEGPGIPDSEKRNVFNKFYRIGNEESRKAKGTGLGLYLTNKIILQHKGRITIKDNTPSGSMFEISLPAAS